MTARADGRVLRTAKVKITTKCNRDCDFCIFSARNQGINMPLDTFTKILDRLALIPFQQLHINGGEPTVHKQFIELSDLARQRLPHAVMVLGTNAITLARNRRLMAATLRCYDQILIGSDDEHRNYDALAAAVPILRAAGKTVVVNTVLEATDTERLAWLGRLCADHGAIHVTNHIHHIEAGQPHVELRGLCHRYRDQHLMIEPDGSCYRCFNAMSRIDSEFSVWDDDFADQVFAERTRHYRFCGRCHEYSDSGVPAAPVRRLLPVANA